MGRVIYLTLLTLMGALEDAIAHSGEARQVGEENLMLRCCGIRLRPPGHLTILARREHRHVGPHDRALLAGLGRPAR